MGQYYPSYVLSGLWSEGNLVYSVRGGPNQMRFRRRKADKPIRRGFGLSATDTIQYS